MPTWPVPHHSLDIADLLSLREGIEALTEFFKHLFTFKKFTHPTPRKETVTSDFFFSVYRFIIFLYVYDHVHFDAYRRFLPVNGHPLSVCSVLRHTSFRHHGHYSVY